MKEPRHVKILSVCCLGIALGLLGLGARQAYIVLPDPNLKVDLPPVSEPHFNEPSFAPRKDFTPPPPPEPPADYAMSDRRLVENTTFTGVVRKDGQLYLTYDASKKRGKRSCPT